MTKDYVSTIVFDKIVDCIFSEPVELRPALLNAILQYKLKVELGKGRSNTAGYLGLRFKRIGGKKVILKDTIKIVIHRCAIEKLIGNSFNGIIVDSIQRGIDVTIEHEVVHFMHIVKTDSPSNHGNEFQRLAHKYFSHTNSKIIRRADE
jgi:hypothetical protein